MMHASYDCLGLPHPHMQSIIHALSDEGGASYARATIAWRPPTLICGQWYTRATIAQPPSPPNWRPMLHASYDACEP